MKASLIIAALAAVVAAVAVPGASPDSLAPSEIRGVSLNARQDSVNSGAANHPSQDCHRCDDYAKQCQQICEHRTDKNCAKDCKKLMCNGWIKPECAAGERCGKDCPKREDSSKAELSKEPPSLTPIVGSAIPREEDTSCKDCDDFMKKCHEYCDNHGVAACEDWCSHAVCNGSGPGECKRGNSCGKHCPKAVKDEPVFPLPGFKRDGVDPTKDLAAVEESDDADAKCSGCDDFMKKCHGYCDNRGVDKCEDWCRHAVCNGSGPGECRRGKSCGKHCPVSAEDQADVKRDDIAPENDPEDDDANQGGKPTPRPGPCQYCINDLNKCKKRCGKNKPCQRDCEVHQCHDGPVGCRLGQTCGKGCHGILALRESANLDEPTSPSQNGNDVNQADPNMPPPPSSGCLLCQNKLENCKKGCHKNKQCEDNCLVELCNNGPALCRPGKFCGGSCPSHLPHSQNGNDVKRDDANPEDTNKQDHMIPPPWNRGCHWCEKQLENCRKGCHKNKQCEDNCLVQLCDSGPDYCRTGKLCGGLCPKPHLLMRGDLNTGSS